MTANANRVISLKWELLEIGPAVDAARISLNECSADQAAAIVTERRCAG